MKVKKILFNEDKTIKGYEFHEEKKLSQKEIKANRQQFKEFLKTIK